MIVAIVGVLGTLASMVITQALSQRARLREVEQVERVRVAEQRAPAELRKVDQLRSCYVQLNAHDRHYRDAMLAYAYALKLGAAGTEAVEVSSARRAQRDARDEAQMIASEEVLTVENRVNIQLTFAYRLLMEVASEPEPSARLTQLDEVIGLLDPVIEKLEHVQALMRVELGVAQELPAWYDP
ncbi:hypothetical protein [Streptomyces olivochromogenes]|uniref:hypothetical protein n=1 Tax=Streptomyces olivochromogenes TaxID=1963 RepID=UPI001F396AD8|nr:hypothetical protein [Streptomyces olivochromogenes]MCF3136188.1 hypothetical protein [Streptomyces olivochromogenes]